MLTYNDIRTMFDDYQWMIKEVIRIRTELDQGGWMKSAVSSFKHGSKSNHISNPVHRDATARERVFKRLEKMENKLNTFNSLLDQVELTDREEFLINCLLDGETLKQSVKYIGISPTHGSRILNRVIDRMLENVGINTI